MSRRVALILVASVFSSSCLPPRDNENDPALVPVAQLRVVDVGTEDVQGNCAPPVVSGLGAVVEATRGRCLVLDASASSDPQGALSTFEYSALDLNGDVLQTIEGGGPVLPILGIVRRSLPIGPVVFRVVVTDADGYADEAIVEFSLLNTPPAIARIAPRVLPLGGHLWAPGAPFDVEFTARASDFDGDDDLSICFTFPPSLSNPSTVEECGAGSTVSFRRSIASDDPLGYEATAVAYDGLTVATRTRSPAVRSLVRVGTVPVWATEGASGGVARIDSLRRSFLGVSPRLASSAFLPSRPAMVVTGQTGAVEDFYLLDWPDGAIGGVGMVGAPYLYVAVDPARSRVWTFGVTGPGVAPSAGLWSVGASGDSVALFPAVALTGIDADVQMPVLQVDADGNLWALNPVFGRSSIAVVSPDGVLLADLGDAAYFTTGLAARPGTSEMWVVDVPSDPLSGPTFARLRRFEGLSVTGTWTISSIGAERIAFAGPDYLWLGHKAEGLVQLDVDALAGSATVENAIRLRVPDILDIQDLVGDPVSGGCWATSITTDRTWTVTGNGSVDALAFPIRLGAVDPHGAIWTHIDSAGEPLRRGAFVGGPGYRAIAFAAGAGAGPDATSGGLWTGGSDPVTLTRLESDGTHGETIAAYVNTAGTLATPSTAGPQRLAPDARALWIYEPYLPGDFSKRVIKRVDLSVRPPLVRVVTGTAGVAAILNPSTDAFFLEPAAPDDARGSFAWTVARAPLRLATLSTAGILTTAVAIPPADIAGTSPNLLIARSSATNSLCYATRDAGNVLRLRRATPEGVVQSLDSTTILGSGALSHVAASWAPGVGDVCWYVWRDSVAPALVHVRGVAGPAQIVADFSETMTRIDSVHMSGDRLAWVVVVNGTQYELVRLDWNGATPLRTSLGVGYFGKLVGPDSPN